MYVNEFNQGKLCVRVTTFNEVTLELRDKTRTVLNQKKKKPTSSFP